MHGNVYFFRIYSLKKYFSRLKKKQNQKFQLYRCTHHLQMEEYWCCLKLILLLNWNVIQKALHLVINSIHLNYWDGQDIISGFQFSQPAFLASNFFTKTAGKQESLLDCRGCQVKLLGIFEWYVSPVSCFQIQAFIGSAAEYGHVLSRYSFALLL